jgi:hypothetical protein
LVRIDHTLSDKDHLMGRYIWFGGNTLSASSLPTNGTSNTPGSQNLAITETHTFSPTFLLETRAGFSRNATNFSVQDVGFNAASLFPGVPGVVDANQNQLDSGLPNIAIAGYATLGGATNLRRDASPTPMNLRKRHQGLAVRMDQTHHQIRLQRPPRGDATIPGRQLARRDHVHGFRPFRRHLSRVQRPELALELVHSHRRHAEPLVSLPARFLCA